MQATVRIPDFEKRGGIVPVIVQDGSTGRVLILAYTRKEEFLETMASGEVVLWSTSRGERWKKGETKSGNVLRLQKLPQLDCDGDALLYIVTQVKPESGACHTGRESCFFRFVVGPVLEGDEKTKFEVASVHPSLR